MNQSVSLQGERAGGTSAGGGAGGSGSGAATGGGLAIPSGVLAQLLGGELVGRPDVILSDVSGLEMAGPNALSFIRSPKFAKMWAQSKAGAALVTRGIAVPGHDPAARAIIFVDDADMGMIKLLQLVAQQVPMHTPGKGVHPTAIVDPTAQIDPSVHIGAHCVVGPKTVIGAGAVLMPRVTLGALVRIGAGVTLHPGVVVYDRCVIGDKAILHSNAVIGADGFGYHADVKTGEHQKIPHIGTVVIGKNVEIGANSCVDRGKFGATQVGDGSKIDNLVQIGHNVLIGRNVIICGVTGIAGSVQIGDGVMIGGHVGVIDSKKIGAGALIGAKSGVLSDVPAGEHWSGLPACPHRQQMRTWAAARRLPEVMRAMTRDTNVQAAVKTKIRNLEL